MKLVIYPDGTMTSSMASQFKSGRAWMQTCDKKTHYEINHQQLYSTWTQPMYPTWIPIAPFKDEFTWSLSWKSGSKLVTCVGGVGDSGGAESSSEIRDGVERSGTSLVMWQLSSCCMVVSPRLSAVGMSATESDSEACWQRTSSTSSSFTKIKGQVKSRF